MDKSLLTFFSEKKTFIFLLMCLGVHICNFLAFVCLGFEQLAILNLLSSVYYVVILLFIEEENEILIVLTYFEILIFALISELLIGGFYGYLYYIIGMISVLSYLLSSKNKHRHLFQGIGVLFAIVVFIIEKKHFTIMPALSLKAYRYTLIFKSCNFGITLFTLIYASTLYINELNITKNLLDYNSNHDQLTGLYNRRFLEHVIERNQVETTSAYCIAMFDIDNFKHFNDEYGHDIGDKVLVLLSGCLSSIQEEKILPVRWGGEEFILYMPQTVLADAEKKVSLICNELSNKGIEFKDNLLKVTVTVGIAEGASLGNYENVIKEADNKLYYGKNHGKNCIVTQL